ncbi:MAG: hypothetical protein ABI534_02200 [Chloroflexota bacterium]
MATYMLVYHGGGSPSSDTEREAVTAAWTQWFTDLGAATVDRGNPTSHSMTVSTDGSVADGGGANPATGYSILSAGSLESAAKLAKGCPHLATGGSVEVAEIFDAM